MGELGALALALAASAGAWAARPLPLVPAAIAIGVALVLRRPVLLVVAVALTASALGARAWEGLRPPATGPWAGTATLVGDPADVAGALRVDVRIGGKRVEAWARGSAARALRDRLAGERVSLRGRVQPVPADARIRLARRHVGARMTVDGASFSSPGAVPARLANGLRRTLLRGAQPLSPERRALFTGFVLGDDRDQRPEVTDDFRASGLSHLLVVSGENVAFVLALLAPFLNRFRLTGRLVGGLAVLVLFGVLTRWEPSVLRAEAMAALALLAAAVGRPASTLRLLSLAVAGLVLVDPLLVRSVGFLLSVGACAGIAVLAVPVAARLPGPRSVAAAMGVTIAAQVGVLPVLVPTFGGLPVAALPANLLAVPVAGPIMMWGMAAGLAAGWAGGPVARVLHLPTGLMIAWVAGVAARSAALPLGQLRPWHLVGLAVAALAGVAASRRGRRGTVATAVLAGVALALAPAFAVLRPSPVHGRAVVAGARLWRGGGASVLVVDDLRASPAALLSALHLADVRTLDVLVVTRPGRAAADNVEPLLRRFPPRLLLAPPGHRLPGDVTVAPAGSRVAAGGLVVTLDADGPRLKATVGSARGPPGSVGGRMRLRLGSHTYDLASRALVMGSVERASSAATAAAIADGADIVEVVDIDGPAAVPVCATAGDDAAVGAALERGARLLRLGAPTAAAYRMCAAAGAAVVVPDASDAAAGEARAAGLAPDLILPDTVLLDVTGACCPLAAAVVGVIGGAGIVRTHDVRAARRVCDVLAAIRSAR
jgi:competence protein ComEC